MKRTTSILLITILSLFLLAGCEKNEGQQVACTICNGSGNVKYYYGDGNNDYNFGPCTSCDGKGYIVVKPSGNSSSGNKAICGSCEKYVDGVVTKEDAAGERRTWCADCWNDYDDMMER